MEVVFRPGDLFSVWRIKPPCSWDQHLEFYYEILIRNEHMNLWESRVEVEKCQNFHLVVTRHVLATI